jgi:hypothetical protein
LYTRSGKGPCVMEGARFEPLGLAFPTPDGNQIHRSLLESRSHDFVACTSFTSPSGSSLEDVLCNICFSSDTEHLPGSSTACFTVFLRASLFRCIVLVLCFQPGDDKYFDFLLKSIRLILINFFKPSIDDMAFFVQIDTFSMRICQHNIEAF